MIAKDLLPAFVSKLSVELAVENLGAFNGDLMCRLSFPGSSTLTVKGIERGLLFSTVVGKTPTKNKEVLYCEAMTANLFGQRNNGPILALDSTEQEVVLLRLLQGELTYERFKESIEDLLNEVDFWKSKWKIAS